MSLLDDLKKSVTDFTENVAQKSTQVIETQKLKMKKSSLESDLRDIYVVLGHLYVRQLGSGFDEGSEEGRLLKRLNENNYIVFGHGRAGCHITRKGEEYLAELTKER